MPECLLPGSGLQFVRERRATSVPRPRPAAPLADGRRVGVSGKADARYQRFNPHHRLYYRLYSLKSWKLGGWKTLISASEGNNFAQTQRPSALIRSDAPNLLRNGPTQA